MQGVYRLASAAATLTAELEAAYALYLWSRAF